MSGEFCLLRQRQRLEAAGGSVRAEWDQSRGGGLRLCAGGLTVDLDAEIAGTSDGKRVRLRQTDDCAPQILPLEEGPARVAVRSLYGLYDSDERLHGDGMQETWLTRHGEVFLAFALRLVPQPGLTIDTAQLRFSVDGLTEPLEQDEARVSGSGTGGSVVLAWPSGRGRRFDAILWQSTQPPFYERWPSYFDQWSLAAESFGWDRRRSGGIVTTSNGASGEVELSWVRGEEVVPAPSVDLRGLVWCGFGAKTRVLQLLEAHEDPREPRVERGTLRCYDELDGSFEIAADAEGRCELQLPPGPDERPVRLRVFNLRGTSGYDISPPGSAQFSAGDTRTDDPLVSVPTVADAPADEVLIDLVGRRDSPIQVVVRPRRDGLHVAYQRRDPNRRLTVHHPLDPKRAVCSIDLSGVRLRGLRFPGTDEPALHDLPLYWMRYLAKASAHLANRLEQVEVLDDGPEQVVVCLHSVTPCGRVESRYELTFPYLDDRVELLVRAHLSGASAWDLPTFEYADLFPANGIAPVDWDFRRIAFVRADSMRVSDPRDPYPTLGEVLELPAGALDAMQQAHAAPDAGPWRFSGTAALVFHGSARGTILAIAANPDASVEHVATLCEHWMDVHLDVAASGRGPVSSEAEGSGGHEPIAIPDELDAELRLQILDPKLSFDEVVATARVLTAAGVS